MVLSFLVDESKLSLVEIFQIKTASKSVKFASGFLVKSQRKGSMNEDGVTDWIKQMWNRRPKKKNIFNWDVFSPHLTIAVKKLV